MSTVYTDPPRTDPGIVAGFAELGVATVHEAQGRTGLMLPYMRPIYAGARAVGTAVTVSLAPADNWMLHVVVEQCREGDVVVAAADLVQRRRLFRRADRPPRSRLGACAAWCSRAAAATWPS